MKCLLCGKEALEDKTIIAKDIDRPLCEEHSLMLKGWLVGSMPTSYPKEISYLQKWIDEFIAQMEISENE